MGEVAWVLQEDPDLGRGLHPADYDVASERAVATVTRLRVGPWTRSRTVRRSAGEWGLLVLDGFLASRIVVGGRSSAELVGPGDFLCPWDAVGVSLPVHAQWTVLEPARLAVLGRRFAVAVGRWPEVPAALMERLVLRSHRLAVQLAAAHRVGIEDRLLVVLWNLADRWGRVTSDGVVLRVPVTHQMLGQMIGVQRPTVSSALGTLRARGQVRQHTSGSWLLVGGPPAMPDLCDHPHAAADEPPGERERPGALAQRPV